MTDRSRAPLWKKLLIDIGVGMAVFLVMMLFRGGFAAAESAERWQQVSDALFVPGVLMLSVGLLVWAADCGVFDMLAYGLKKAFSVMRSEEKRAAIPKTFYDYRMLHDARERAHIGHLMLAGLLFIIAAAFALAMYARYEPLV